MRLTILGRVPSKKNSKRPFIRNGRIMLFPSKDYVAWHKDALKQVTRGQKMPQDASYAVDVTIYPPDRIKGDLTNKAESILDLLVDAGVIADDNWFVVHNVKLSFGGVDKERPRAEVVIY